MAQQNRTTLKTYFQTSDLPTEAQFADFIDSCFNPSNDTLDAIPEGTTYKLFTPAERTKLAGIEAAADVTDTANVTAAGALMDSECASLPDVKALNQSVVSGASPTFGTGNMTDATNRRFMTDAQETKLDSVESGADVTDAANVSAAGAPIISSGAGAPASTPSKVGDIYIDTTGDDAYIAVGTASSADWEKSNDGTGGGGGISDGDKGDITVSGSGTVWTVDNDAITFAKTQNIASARMLGRSTAGSGDIEELTAAQARSNIGVMNIVVLASDYANSNAVANTLEDVTDFKFPVVSGETYYFHIVTDLTTAATTTGYRVAINGPAATRMSYRNVSGLTSTTQTIAHGLTAYSLPAASGATSPATGGNISVIEGFITPSASGDVQVRIASEVSSSTVTAKAGSIIEWYRCL